MEFIVTLLGFFFLAASQCHCQIHESLDAAITSRHQCFACDSVHDKNFPACLYEDSTTCSSRDSCKITYTQDSDVEIKCSSNCHHFSNSNVHSADCPHGGIKHDGECETCCTDSNCITSTATALRAAVVNSNQVFCPGHCSTNNMEDCLKSGVMCSAQQFCSINVRHHTRLEGHCVDDSILRSCRLEKLKGTCTLYGHGTHFILNTNCQYDCCDTNECVRQHFKHYSPLTNVVSTAATTPTTTTTTEATTSTTQPPPSPTPSFFQKFETSCSDQLETGACTLLQSTQHICQDRVAIELCPETCGVCQAIRTANCHDTVLNDGCADLEANKHICDEVTAKYACPKTCGICDGIIDNLVQDILDGKTITTTPASTVAGSTTMSIQQTGFNCLDLEKMPCDDVIVACNTTATIQSECQQQCMKCNGVTD